MSQKGFVSIGIGVGGGGGIDSLCIVKLMDGLTDY